MQWWAVLLIVIGTQAIFLLVVWLMTRKFRPTGDERLEAEKSRADRLQEEVKAEKSAYLKVEDELRKFGEEMKKVSLWYNENKDKIEKEASDAIQNLVNNPDAIDKRLDELLGFRPDADPDATPKG